MRSTEEKTLPLGCVAGVGTVASHHDRPWLRVPRHIGREATGLAAVAGGLTETFLLLGLLVTVVFEVAAIILLVRAFERGHWLRSLFLAFSLCLSGLMLLLFGIFLWLSWFRMHHPM
jgi:hypothetical protein